MWLARWVIQPVLAEVGPALRTALADGLAPGHAMDDALDYLVERADELADFSALSAAGPAGDAVAMLLEIVSDHLLEAARGDLRRLLEVELKKIQAQQET